MLLFALVQELDTNNKWTDDNVIALKQCKTNICKGKTSHFNSKGYYASFGNKANYAIIDNSSISQYSTKKSSNKLKQVLVNDSAHLFEYLSASEIDRSIISFARYLRKIPELLSPVVNEAFNSQNQWGNINLKPVATSKSGLWQSQICIDASTSTAHTENDCTYTVISIPEQEKRFSKKVRNESYFLFVLDKQHKVSITLQPNVAFYFSGLCLVHRQNHPSQEIHGINFSTLRHMVISDFTTIFVLHSKG